MSAAIELRSVTKRFGDFTAVDDVSVAVVEGEFFSLLGPSGCGKTTSLRMLAGFVAPDSGAVLLRGADVTAMPPHRRPVNLVFQSYELFPHLTVFDNVAFGLRLKKLPRTEIAARVARMLEVVRTEGLAQRYPKELSGGQQQRVALARALANEPAVLLLDEPLSALDVKLRKEMQQELKSIQHSLGTTFVYVTHDQEEALLLSDRIAIMNGGRVLQVAPPRDIYERPADRFVASFVGSLNVVSLRVDEREGDVVVMRPSADERVSVAAPDANGTVALAVRPERERLEAPGSTGGDVRLHGTVEAADYVGTTTQVRVRTACGTLWSQRLNAGGAPPAPGDRVLVTWDRAAGFALPEET